MKAQHEKKQIPLFSFDAILASSYLPRINESLGNVCALLGELLGNFDGISNIYLLDDKDLPEGNVEMTVLRAFNPGLYVRASNVKIRNPHVYLIEVRPSNEILIHENIAREQFYEHSDEKFKDIIFELNAKGKVIGRELRIFGGGYHLVAGLIAHYASEKLIDLYMPTIKNITAKRVGYPSVSVAPTSSLVNMTSFFYLMEMEMPKQNKWEKFLSLNFTIIRDGNGDISNIAQKLKFRVSVFQFINDEQFSENDKAWVKHLDNVNCEKESARPMTPPGKWLKDKMGEHGIKYADEQESKNSLC